MPALRRALFVAVPVTAVCIGVGVAVVQPSQHQTPTRTSAPAAEASTPTSLAEVDTSSMVVRRQAFCARVPAAEVTAALGGRPVRATSYGDGQTAALTPTLRDVAGEFDCTWRGRGGASAQAWVFATPVTPYRARTLTAPPSGCERQPGPAYGRPTVTLACTDRGRSTVSLRGLFGDAWLSCSLTGHRREPETAVAERADRWCLTVARAAG